MSSTLKPFRVGGRYHIETCPLICFANGFYMISASDAKGLREGGEAYTVTHKNDLKKKFPNAYCE